MLAKLTWFRSGGETSERQWTDVLGLLRIATLDEPYFRAGAEGRGLAQGDRAIVEVGPESR